MVAGRPSQAAAILKIAAALTLGTVGTVVLRRRVGFASAARAIRRCESLATRTGPASLMLYLESFNDKES